MRYTGNKSRIAKLILPIILKDRKPNQYYVEPFVGGANLIDKVEGLRIGADSNEYVIELLKSLQDGWTPPDRISREEYYYIKENKDENKALTAWVGVCCSYGGKWFGGFLSDYQESKRTKNGRLPNHQDEARRGVLKQVANLTSIHFIHSDYAFLEIPENSIIYCDPPYMNTVKYKDEIGYSHFWNWCRSMHHEGHTIFVSEYEAPSDFTCVWSKEVSNTLSKQNKFKSVEKLFTLK